jgi:hypothetical protein
VLAFFPSPINAKAELLLFSSKNYGTISRPHTNLLKKGEDFPWTPVTDAAFQELKTWLVHVPVLALRDSSKPFVVKTDACQYGVGVVLMQQGHPIAYLSMALFPRNQTLSIYKKECLAILMDVNKWRSYLQHQEFTIRTDQKSLHHLTEQRFRTGIQHKSFMKLIGLRYTIQYKKGITNAAANALSRRPPPVDFMAISSVVPSWLDKLVAGYSDNASTKKLWAELSVIGSIQRDLPWNKASFVSMVRSGTGQRSRTAAHLASSACE